MTKRSIQKQREALSSNGVYAPPITEPSRPEVEAIYRDLVGAMPSTTRTMASMRALALEAAEAMHTIERMDAMLTAQGEIQTDARGIMRAHPAVEIRHKNSVRLMALMTKLRLLPAQDKRDLQKTAQYETQVAGAFTGGSLTQFDPIPSKANGEPDWVAYRKAKNAPH